MAIFMEKYFYLKLEMREAPTKPVYDESGNLQSVLEKTNIVPGLTLTKNKVARGARF